jgi:hypothetical protein
VDVSRDSLGAATRAGKQKGSHGRQSPVTRRPLQQAEETERGSVDKEGSLGDRGGSRSSKT